MKALLDFVPLIIFFYLYKTVDPKNTDHPLLQLIGSAGGVDNNNILVATTGLIISMLVVYGALFFMQKFRLDKQQWIVLFMTVIFGGVTLMLSDDFYIKLKAALLNIIFSGAFLLSPYFGKERKPLIKRLFRPNLQFIRLGLDKFKLCMGCYVCPHVFFTRIFRIFIYGRKILGRIHGFW